MIKKSDIRRIARVYGREQASRAYITGESMEEDDMVKSRVGNTPSTERERETNRWGRKGCKPKGSYKEVPRPSRGLALAAAKRSLTIVALIEVSTKGRCDTKIF